jgi:hypothetical protein
MINDWLTGMGEGHWGRIKKWNLLSERMVWNESSTSKELSLLICKLKGLEDMTLMFLLA